MTTISQLAREAIVIFQQHLACLAVTPLIHFELEGCCQLPANQQLTQWHFNYINQQLQRYDIEAELVNEYWHNQWEYVSKFSGQLPLKEAENLDQALTLLPQLFARLGIERTLIQPVVWSGDSGQLAGGSQSIFAPMSRAVHIPNAIQLNVSVLNSQGDNLVAQEQFGELLQACLINTSLECCLLYLPENDAFERLALKSKYGLAQELCSPIDISGGHQGSVALYRQQGKHNQPMGMKALVVDQHQQALVSEQNWQQGARVEHRLGAASKHYNAFVNVAYALANVVDAIEMFFAGVNKDIDGQLAKASSVQALPGQMYGDDGSFNAYALFKQSEWLTQRIAKSQQFINKSCTSVTNSALGQQLKHSILNLYQAGGIASAEKVTY